MQGVGGLKSADCRPANWGPAAARGSPVRGSPSSMPRMVVGDPEPTPQLQKLPNTMRTWVMPWTGLKPLKNEIGAEVSKQPLRFLISSFHISE